jgi:hypothetical protein
VYKKEGREKEREEKSASESTQTIKYQLPMENNYHTP